MTGSLDELFVCQEDAEQRAFSRTFVPGIRSTRSLTRSANAEVSILALSRTVSDSATDDPISSPQEFRTTPYFDKWPLPYSVGTDFSL